MERDLNFEFDTNSEMIKMLTGAVMDARRGTLGYDTVKSITLIADKINKANVNALQYKSLIKNNEDDNKFFKLT